MTRWSDVPGRGSAEQYQSRFDRLAKAGHDVHGEAGFCTRQVARGARVLDAGCGTGRVALELARRGYDVTGVDLDPGMLARARALGPDLIWAQADLVTFDPAAFGSFDLVLAAGNVMPLVAAGTEAQVVVNLAAALRPGGLLVAGFGLDPAHLPLPQAPFGLGDYDSWCAAAGLQLSARYATWDGAPYVADAGYAVSVHSGSAA